MNFLKNYLPDLIVLLIAVVLGSGAVLYATGCKTSDSLVAEKDIKFDDIDPAGREALGCLVLNTGEQASGSKDVVCRPYADERARYMAEERLYKRMVRCDKFATVCKTENDCEKSDLKFQQCWDKLNQK